MMQGNPPSAEERELYYFGLPSLPKLVARSSSHEWVNPQMPSHSGYTGTANMYPKRLRPVGRHPLLHLLWNDALSSLRTKILDAVQELDWTALDILRVGINEAYPITLMVAVKPGTVSWTHGHQVSLRCKSIFEEHGIHDVDCEIRESLVTRLTEPASSATPANLQLSSSHPLLPGDDISADLTDCLGTRIARKDREHKVGSKGLYLSLPSSEPQGEPKLLALTCRHVVLDPQTEGLDEYRRPESGPFKDVIQLDQPTLERKVEYYEREAKYYEQEAKKYAKPGQAELAASLVNHKDILETLRKTLTTFQTPSSRVIGQILYSPEFSCATEDRGQQWLRDWALIELQPSSHQAALSSIKNKVFVGPIPVFENIVMVGEPGWRGLSKPRLPSDITGSCFNLRKEAVPIKELLNPPEISEGFDEPAMCVAKFGAQSKMTIGIANTLLSVTRMTTETPDGDRTTTSEEWAIMSVQRRGEMHGRFSEPGDSGSCVWTMDYRPAGIIMAGSGSMNGLVDVTYAQPVERLLDDIRSHGFDVSLV